MKTRVAVAQMKPTLGNVDKNLEIAEAIIEKAQINEADLLVFPELALTGYYLRDMVPVVAMHDEHAVISKMLEHSRSMSIAFGYVEESADNRFYNSALYLEDGRIVHRHRKVYLPTYGMFDELRYFAPGESVSAFDTKFGRIGMLICEDVWHLSTGCILSADGANIMIHLASSPARGMKAKERLDIYDTWENLNRTYASSFCCYVIFANRVGCEDGLTFWGGSEVIDPDCKVAAKAQYLDEELLVVDIDPEKVRRARMYTPVRRDEKILLTLRELQRIAVREKLAYGE
ncbi:MAG: carbon-nitrogen hydrolase [Candidatus Abyssobacteria bacterium SURF_17]|uniref:Carbon-nitrogen hydrolase n=1 Tax=Candidatus Abyssobacteria bacterium SURF_17 TaxID=2093361 RepID=A0A419ESM0_9BACT|nr:MAG: carbon-nitrogen hydrolase [Candidatus Abyssubacteria bacterium SURF_17]